MGRDRIGEIEKKTVENQKLLMRLVMAYTEVERLQKEAAFKR